VEKTAMETYDLLKVAFSNEAISHSTACEWYKCFKNGLGSWDDDHRSDHPPVTLTDKKINTINALVQSD
jgi:hypothetical protein